MTNEELVIKIQDGESECIYELWERCRNLLYKVLKKISKNYTLPNSVSQEDLEQGLFFALKTAVKYYNRSKTYLFNTYLNYSVQAVIKNFIPDWNIDEISIYTPVGKDEDMELVELIEDNRAECAYEWLEEYDLRKIVRKAVNELPYEQRQVIIMSIFNNMTYAQMEAVTGKTVSKLRSEYCKAIRQLRNNKALQAVNSVY